MSKDKRKNVRRYSPLGITRATSGAPGMKKPRRKQDSKRRWKARLQLGRPVPVWAIVAHGLWVPPWFEHDITAQTVRRVVFHAQA